MKGDTALQARAQAFVADLLEVIRQEPDFEHALTLAVWLGRYLWVNFCGIYRLDDLELILLDKLDVPASLDVSDGPVRELQVASAVFRNGGHSPLMRSLITEAAEPPDVLMTWPTTALEAGGILAVDPARVEVPLIDQPISARVVRWATKMAGYDRVILHLHPDDVAAALAVRLAKQVKPSLFVGFMNHADHAFSAAIGVADKVFEISAYGWALRAQRQSEQRSTFVGIPIAPPLQRPDGGGQGGYAFTGGTAFKYKPFRGHSLPVVLMELLRRDQSIRLKIIGPDSRDYWWWPLRMRGGQRVQMMKAVPRDEYLKLLNDCAYYIDSYPWPGGTAFPEALMRGGLVAAIQGGSSGYSYADVLRSHSAEDFLDVCIKLAAKDDAALRLQAEVRQRCIAFHAPSAVRARMEQGMDPLHIEWPPQEMLARQQIPAAELDWMDNGRSITPSLKKLTLNRAMRAVLLRLHARHFGRLRHSSLKLGFDLYLKKVKV